MVKSLHSRPGTYAPYNPTVPDLTSYLDGPNYGDSAMRDSYFQIGRAGSIGVQPGSAEPK
jgi:hypothetical protein